MKAMKLKYIIMQNMPNIFAPSLTFFDSEEPLSGVACIMLQLSIVGWLPAFIWAQKHSI